MATIWTIAAHHLRRVARRPGLVLLLLAVPFTLSVIEYAAFGPMATRGSLPVITVLLLDEDRSLASGALPQFLAGGPLKKTLSIVPASGRDAARRAFQRNEAAALITIPAGFQAALLDGRRAELCFAPNPLQTFSPRIAESVLEVVALIANALYQHAADPIARITALGDEGREATTEELAAISRGFFEAGRRLERLSALQEPVVTLVREGGEQESGRIGVTPGEFFAYVFPGLAIFALYFVSQVLAVRLLRDRDAGLHRRLAAAPISHASLLAGGVLYLVIGLFAILVVVGVVGAVVFRLPFREPAALLVIGAGFALFASGLQLLIAALAANERSVSFIGTVVVMVLSLAGGTFVPADQMPEPLQHVARLVPNGAAQQAFIELLVGGRQPADVAGLAGITWLWAVAALGVALVLERRRLRA